MNICYLDSNIFSIFADDPSLANRFRAFIESKNLTLSLSDVNLAEISDATRKHEKIADFICSGPTALIKNQEMLLAEEVENYPNSFDHNPLLGWTSELPNERQQLLEKLVSEDMSNSRNEMKRNAIKMRKVINERKNNFPPRANGKYTKEQAVQFSEQKVLEQLCSRAPNFIQRFKDDLASLDISYFRSLRVIPFLSFFRYYLSGRVPNDGSDLGDMFHPAYFPYSRFAVLENDLAENMRQIKTVENSVSTLEIKTVAFLRDL